MHRQDAKDATGVRTEPDAEIDGLASAVIGAAVEVHGALGPGFVEAVYEEALAVELGLRRIPFVRQVPVGVCYKGRAVGNTRLDLVVGERLIVELKAVDALLPIHLAQALSYLKASDLPLALMINFNVSVLLRGVRRVIRSGGEPPFGWRPWRPGG